jgi:predicted nucleotidyltransferase
MTTGIIVEYNPMHTGHLLHVQKARTDSQDTLIAVMSGWFVQRGEPAITDPYSRARIAVENGVDLVLLLPVVHSIQSAEYFAKGAVDILLTAGVDRIVYGSEQTDALQKNATDETKLKQALQNGDSYAGAMQKARGGVFLDANSRLGLCYQNAVKDKRAHVEVCSVYRAPWPGSSVPVSEQNASALRKQMHTGTLPEDVLGSPPGPYAALEDYKEILRYLLFFPREDPSRFPYYEPGLTNRLRNTYTRANTMEEWITLARSKRHTMARIRRFLLHLLLHLPQKEVLRYRDQPPDALYPLAMNEKGRAYLRSRKNTLPILSTKKALRKYSAQNETRYQWDLLAEQIYAYPIRKQKVNP